MFSLSSYFVTAAAVVQHSILSVRLLADSPIPVACNMRNCSAPIGKEHLAPEGEMETGMA
jgi:ferredoxin